MAKVNVNTLRNWFKNGLKPSQEHFWNWLDSFWHKDEAIPSNKIEGLEDLLQDKAEAIQLANHTNDTNAHGLDQLHTEVQQRMRLSDFVENGKIRADKLQALALSETIKSSEGTLADFIANSASYNFQQNDFIAIPQADNSFKLLLFIGQDKSDPEAYLPTGLSNINATQIGDLQDYVKDLLVADLEINRTGNELSFGVKRTIGSASASSTFWQTFGIISLGFEQLELNQTAQQGLPNTITNDGANLTYTDHNGIPDYVTTKSDLTGISTINPEIMLDNPFGRYNTLPQFSQGLAAFTVNMATAVIGGSALMVINTPNKPMLPSTCRLINDSWVSGVDVAYHFLCVSANTVHVKTYIV